MDPLAATGLVGNILSFIDYSLKALDVAKGIYKSATGSTSENEHLAFVAGEVRKLAVRLESSKPDALMSEDEKSVDLVAKKCRKIADDLLELLGSL